MADTDAALECPVCRDLMVDATSTNCGHSFCASCLNQCLRANTSICPVCRKAITNVFPVYNLRQAIASRRQALGQPEPTPSTVDRDDFVHVTAPSRRQVPPADGDTSNNEADAGGTTEQDEELRATLEQVHAGVLPSSPGPGSHGANSFVHARSTKVAFLAVAAGYGLLSLIGLDGDTTVDILFIMGILVFFIYNLRW